ncbi:MAG: hypothetical protein SF069_10965 [Phycisphaerae bacterium]|nr:hypothetical protein [Phycisphaerae bacterium]
MMRFVPTLLGIVACMTLAGCSNGESSTDDWIDQLRVFFVEFARNALAALLI